MEPSSDDDTSKKAVRWLVIAILLVMLLVVARHVQGQASQLGVNGTASSRVALDLRGQAASFSRAA